jgi:outer membrane protein W
MPYLKTLLAVLVLLPAAGSFAQTKNNDIRDEYEHYLPDNSKWEPVKKWSLNLSFSDNGFGGGATLYKYLSKDVSAFGSLYFSAAKDDREFETTDIYGNTYVPYKVNRLFMIPVDLGVQYRLFRDDVTDDLRPNVSFGLTPAAIIYTPYNEGLISSFGKARAKYTVGGFVGIGVDYLTSKTTSLSMNVRYYYINLFDNGIESLQGKQKTFFGGMYFNFSYNFMH